MDHLFKSSSKRLDAVKNQDWSREIGADADRLHLQVARELSLPGEVTAMAFDPLQSLFAVGTAAGSLHVWGAPAVTLTWRNRPTHQIKHLAFKGSLLLCVDVKDTLAVYNLAEIEDNVPFREATHSVRSVVTSIEVSPAHSHLFLGLRDGTVDCYDLDRGVLSPYRIPNMWLEQEELLRRSGVPGAPSRRHIPVCTDLKIHPRDLDLLLIGYEGGVTLYSLLSRTPLRSFELVFPPGAAGGSLADPSTLFEERRPNVTCLSWRPDGLVFAAGYEDGSFALWAVEDGDKPLVVRTLDKEDVMAFDWADGGPTTHSAGPAGLREPIFRLAWTGFPEEGLLSWMANAAAGTAAAKSPTTTAAAGTAAEGEPTSPRSPTSGLPAFGWGAGSSTKPATSPHEEEAKQHGTMLLILGGLLPSDPTGVHVLHLPAYVAPPTSWQASQVSGMSTALRDSLVDSLKPTGHSIYLTATPPEDFLLLPRSNPYYGGSFDPTAIVISTSQDPSLPPLPSPHAVRTVRAYTFPPSLTREPTELSLPGPLSTVGARTICSCDVFELPPASYRKLTDTSEDETGRVQLRGGKAAPAPAAADIRGVKSERRRLLVTTHLDLSVRFWDLSIQLLTSEGGNVHDAADLNDESGRVFAGKLKHEFPRPLHHLTLELADLMARAKPVDPTHPSPLPMQRWTTSVNLGVEPLELAITLNTGEMLVHRFGYASPGEVFDRQSHDDFVDRPLPPLPETDPTGDALSHAMNDAFTDLSFPPPKPTKPPPRPPKSRRRQPVAAEPAEPVHHPAHHSSVNELVSLAAFGTPARECFQPITMLSGPQPIQHVAMSSLGFVAASHDGMVYIVDLRGPDVIFAEVVAAAVKQHKSKAPPRVVLLGWTVAEVGTDAEVTPRLIVGQSDGTIRFVTVSHALDMWVARSNASHALTHDTVDDPIATFVLDAKGNPRHADFAGQSNAEMYHHLGADRDSVSTLLLVVGLESAAIFADVVGPRVAKAEFGEEIVAAELFQHHGSVALRLVDSKRTAFILALPSLSLIKRLPLPTITSSHETGKIDLDAIGDLIESVDPVRIVLQTSLGDRCAAYAPSVSAHSSSIVTPAPPTNASVVVATFNSWFGGKAAIARPEDIDNALAGPKRPEKKVRKALRPARTIKAPQRNQVIRGQAADTRDQLSHNADALNEREDRLKFLNDAVTDASTAATDLVNQAKRLAARESGKATFSASMAGMGTGVKSFFK